MVKYYLFNPNPSDSEPLRIPVTLSEYEKVRKSPDRWFIDLGDLVLEVTKEQHEKYDKVDRHSRYLRRVASRSGRTQSLSTLEEAITYEMSIFSTSESSSVEDLVIEKLMRSEIYQKLWDAIRNLAEDERYLVIKLHIRQEKQSKIAKGLGVSQQTVSKRILKILQKLRKLLDKDEI